MTKRRPAQKVTLAERQEIALRKLYDWEYASTLTLSLSEMRRRAEFLEKAIAVCCEFGPGQIEHLTKVCQLEAVRDAATARGFYRPTD